ncbi:rhomboid family intramembrane serine protease [Pedobacter sp. SYSU D00535]|uniref:rhomboid family intramembrane serine protease n=1 Tax=Pedobacter sp. SYSU D00535 TaxID=2810308 RepID=UPI001A95AE78|nr:rhomboid family intramembrane serine protease [Pedobacter sp. SYSU D00535]
MNGYGSPFANIPPVVKNLLIINVIFYIATLSFNKGDDSNWMIETFGVYYFHSPNFRVWQVVSYMFMHSSSNFMHILFNMFALFSFGPALEYTLGSKRFFNFYLLTGLGALVLQMLVQAIEVHSITGQFMPDAYALTGITDPEEYYTLQGIYRMPMVGASGAIFGILTGFGLLFPNAELMLLFLPVPIKAKYLIPIYIVLELFLGVKQIAGDSVAHFAHLGGALFGFLLIKLWRIRRPGGFL